MLNIDWKKVKFEEVSFEEWNDTVNKLIKNGYKCEFVARTVNCQQKITGVFKLIGKFFVQAIRNNHYAILFYFDLEKESFRKLRFSTNPNTEEEIEFVGQGSIAYRTIVKEFKKNNPKTENFSIIFNGKNAKYRKDIKRCCPAPITYCLDFSTKFFYSKNFFKADVSSAYAYEATKTLPDLSNAVIKNGRHKATKDYPFAFEIKSRHMMILDGNDTISSRELLKSKFYKPSTMIDGNNRYDDSVSDEDEITILCPVSPYSLKKEMETFYAKRKTDPMAKLTLNAFLGYLQNNSSPVAPQIAAAILLRCVYRQVKIAETVETFGNKVVLINTDSVAWIGKECSDVIDSEKKLGANNLEHADAEVIIMGVKKYQIKDNEKVKTVIAGVPKEEQNKLKFLDIMNENHFYKKDISLFSVDDNGILKKRGAIL